MPCTSPKQLEIQQRESRILEAARSLIIRDGYHGLSMDRIAEQIDSSKGTVYNHFGCKEEIIVALALQTTERRYQVFQAAAQFRGKSRFRMLAIVLADQYFCDEYPDHSLFEQMLRIESIREKASEERRHLIRSCETRCVAVVAGIVRDAIANEDLTLPADQTPEDLVFGLWSLCWGAQSIMHSTESLSELGVQSPKITLLDHVQRILDSYSWVPRSNAFDWNEIEQRIFREVLKAR